jgi:hypothetical protein
MKDFFSKAFNDATPDLNEFFQASAQQHGWPNSVAKELKIKVDADGVHAEYDANLEKEIENLEYGMLQSPAKAALRNFSYEADKILDHVLTYRGAEALIDKGVIV